MNYFQILNEIAIQRDIFISKYFVEPQTIAISKKDLKTIKNHHKQNNFPWHKNGGVYVYGIKILRTNDLKSGEFKLSINLD